MEFSGIVKVRERKDENNGITKENKAKRRIIKLFTMKRDKTKNQQM